MAEDMSSIDKILAEVHSKYVPQNAAVFDANITVKTSRASRTARAE